MRKEQEQYIRSLYAQILEAERQMRDKPMPELTREDFFLFHTTGNRLVYEGAYFGRRKYLTVYAILALWSRELSRRGIIEETIGELAEADYIKRLEEILLAICCEEQFWALPAHVDFSGIDHPEAAPAGELQEASITVDLFAAETAQALSEIVLRLYDRLSCEVVTRVAGDVIRRVLQPFAASAVPYSWWETDRCNWSAVCAGAVGMAAINIDRLNRKIMAEHMPPDMPKDKPVSLTVLCYNNAFRQLPDGWKEHCLKRACDALQCYLDGMEADGACTEGLGYYNYGMSFYAAFAEEYAAQAQHGGTDDGRLMYREKCEQIALFQQKCYFRNRAGGGLSISFSDGSRHESFLPGLTAYLKHCYPQVKTPDYQLARPFDEDACYRYLTNERNISWLLRYAQEDGECDMSEAQKTAYLLPAAQWLICQDAHGNGFAAKGGSNDENHNHNDIGHFLCVYNGEMLLTDLGAGEYTKDYFNDRRYDILCNRALGHSVPIINGAEQCAGGQYRADCFAWDEDAQELTISFAGAYPEGSIEKLVRRIRICGSHLLPSIEETASHMQQEPQSRHQNQTAKMQLELRDEFIVNEHTKTIAENLVTEYEPVIRDGAVWLRGQRGQCSIEMENNRDTAPQIIPCVHWDHAGNRQTVYRIVWEFHVEREARLCCGMWITFYDKDVNS